MTENLVTHSPRVGWSVTANLYVRRSLLPLPFADTERGNGNRHMTDDSPDDLKSILAEIDRVPATQDPDLAGRVRLCRRALELTDRQEYPEIWATLHAETGVSLFLSRYADPSKNIELALQSYRVALEEFTLEATPRDWAEVQANMANAYASRALGDRGENLERAIDGHRAALKVYALDSTPIQWAGTQINLAYAYWLRIRGNRAENLEEAIKGYENALQAFHKDTHPTEWAFIQMNLANAYKDRICGDRGENLERAIAYSREALGLLDRNAQPVEWTKASINLAISYHERVRGDRRQNLESAITGYLAVFELVTREEFPLEWAVTQMNLANAYMDRIEGDHGENIELCIARNRAALEWFERQEMQMERAKVTMNLASAYCKRIRGNRAENLERAIEYLNAELEVVTCDALPIQWADMQTNLAIAYMDRIGGDRCENLERAIQCCTAALEVRTRDTLPLGWANTQMNLASVYLQRIRGDREQNLEYAIQHCRAAMEVVTRDSLPLDWAKNRLNMASAYSDRRGGNPRVNQAVSIQLYNETLQVLTHEAMPMDWATAQMGLANVYSDRLTGDREANLELAIEGYEAALQVFTRETFPWNWASAQLNLANAHQNRISGDRKRNLNRAIECNRAGLTIFTLELATLEHMKVHLNLGHLFFHEEDWGEAAENFEAVQKAHNLLYKTAQTEEARHATLRQVREVPALLAYALARIRNGENLKTAACVLENGRGRSLAEILRLNELSLNDLPPGDRVRFESIRDRIQALQSEARRGDAAPARRSFLEISEELRDKYGELEQAIAGIQDGHSDFLPVTDFGTIQRAARCPLIYLATTEAGGMALILDHSADITLEWLPKLSTSALIEKIDGYFAAFYNQHNNLEQWIRILDGMLDWLWEALMSRVVPALAASPEAVLIPGGWLQLLPLHAARTADSSQKDGWRYALDTVRFRYAASARALLTNAASLPAADVESLFAVAEPLPVTGQSLPGSELEVEAARSHFARCQIVRHRDATRQAVLAAMPAHAVLHFSCHGRPDLENPLDGGLVMAHGEVLTLRDLLDLRLPGARLAVLSACASGMLGPELPDEVLSLPTGLIQAGVKGVVSSQWFVSDASTMMLMSRFYELWREYKMDPPEALHAAQNWLRHAPKEELRAVFGEAFPEVASVRMPFSADVPPQWAHVEHPAAGDFSHPFHWAAFTYTGS